MRTQDALAFLKEMTMGLLDPQQVRRYVVAWWRAMRFFSLTCALIPTLLGSVLAYRDGPVLWWQVALVILAGCAIQGGVNLVNDFFEFKQGRLPEKNSDLAIFGKRRSVLELFIFLTGLAMFGLAVPIGLYFAYIRGWAVLAIGIVGFLGGYFYTGWPIAYKNHALAVVLVFWLMGPLMVAGSYYCLRGSMCLASWLAAVPVGMLCQALLVSNEIRDYEDDKERGILTLTVALGPERGKRLHLGLLVSGWVTTVLLVIFRILPWTVLFSLISIITAKDALRYRDLPKGQRQPFVVLTSRVHLWHGLLYCMGILLGVTLA
jgi:1,4-dihydroxy-2-naphthoate polyprenyltransferase